MDGSRSPLEAHGLAIMVNFLLTRMGQMNHPRDVDGLQIEVSEDLFLPLRLRATRRVKPTLGSTRLKSVQDGGNCLHTNSANRGNTPPRRALLVSPRTRERGAVLSWTGLDPIASASDDHSARESACPVPPSWGSCRFPVLKALADAPVIGHISSQVVHSGRPMFSGRGENPHRR